MGDLKYRRILLKLSGEIMMGPQGTSMDFDRIDALAAGPLKTLVGLGAQVGVVIGGGNVLRGGQAQSRGAAIDRAVLDDLGMLATVMNCVALRGALERHGVAARVLTATPMDKVADLFTRARARRLLDAGVVTLFAGGTGNPYFSTDTAAALRGAEIGADAVFKATNVDGVYDKDPNRHADAKRYDRLTYAEAIGEELGVMDLTAFSICRDQGLPIMVFAFDPPENIIALAQGAAIGTTIGGSEQ